MRAHSTLYGARAPHRATPHPGCWIVHERPHTVQSFDDHVRGEQTCNRICACTTAKRSSPPTNTGQPHQAHPATSESTAVSCRPRHWRPEHSEWNKSGARDRPRVPPNRGRMRNASAHLVIYHLTGPHPRIICYRGFHLCHNTPSSTLSDRAQCGPNRGLVSRRPTPRSTGHLALPQIRTRLPDDPHSRTQLISSPAQL